MLNVLKFLAVFPARCLPLLFLLAPVSTAFAEPLDDVGTGKPCPQCSTINTSPNGADDTVTDDVGTGSTGSWRDLLEWVLLTGSMESED